MGFSCQDLKKYRESAKISRSPRNDLKHWLDKWEKIRLPSCGRLERKCPDRFKTSLNGLQAELRAKFFII